GTVIVRSYEFPDCTSFKLAVKCVPCFSTLEIFKGCRSWLMMCNVCSFFSSGYKLIYAPEIGSTSITGSIEPLSVKVNLGWAGSLELSSASRSIGPEKDVVFQSTWMNPSPPGGISCLNFAVSVGRLKSIRSSINGAVPSFFTWNLWVIFSPCFTFPKLKVFSTNTARGTPGVSEKHTPCRTPNRTMLVNRIFMENKTPENSERPNYFGL